MDATKDVFTYMAHIDLLIGIIIFFMVYAFLKLFRTKRIYFVRHGETILNAAHIRQDARGGLSEKGKEQARETGQRLAAMHLEHMYVSPYERTIETAAIIREYIHVPFTYTSLLVERRNPSSIVGKQYDDPEVKKITDLIDLGFYNASLRILDEENFLDMKIRAKKLLRYLLFRPHTSILCVTHGIFLKMILAYIHVGRTLDVSEYVTLGFLNKVDNAGVTLVTHNPWRFLIGKPNWQILAFNDVSKINL